MQNLRRVRTAAFCSVIAACGLAPWGSGCSDPSPDPYQPLSEACDACLLEPGAEGCGDSYEACEELESCEPVVLCELGQGCYNEPSDGDCSRVKGCESGADEAELDAAAAFEACARSVCADVCSFKE